MEDLFLQVTGLHRALWFCISMSCLIVFLFASSFAKKCNGLYMVLAYVFFMFTVFVLVHKSTIFGFIYGESEAWNVIKTLLLIYAVLTVFAFVIYFLTTGIDNIVNKYKAKKQGLTPKEYREAQERAIEKAIQQMKEEGKI